MSNQLQQIQEVQEIPSELLHLIKQAVLIRKTEEKLLELFSLGKLNGTVHTCVGQELSAVAVLNNLLQDDFVVSNHRGHGHYIARTGDIKGMIAEILGKKSGSVGGIGGSQHLANHKYLSNGIQGGMTPIISGIYRRWYFW
jgi:2-oxoisovalerate dehydrogenase E1 component